MFIHCFTAEEVTVGKVYAALMIFDFYKQNKGNRDQSHQQPGVLSQVRDEVGSSRWRLPKFNDFSKELLQIKLI